MCAFTQKREVVDHDLLIEVELALVVRQDGLSDLGLPLFSASASLHGHLAEHLRYDLGQPLQHDSLLRQLVEALRQWCRRQSSRLELLQLTLEEHV